MKVSPKSLRVFSRPQFQPTSSRSADFSFSLRHAESIKVDDRAKILKVLAVAKMVSGSFLETFARLLKRFPHYRKHYDVNNKSNKSNYSNCNDSELLIAKITKKDE